MDILVRFGKRHHFAGNTVMNFTAMNIGEIFRSTITLHGGLFQGNSVSRELKIEAVDNDNGAVYVIICGV